MDRETEKALQEMEADKIYRSLFAERTPEIIRQRFAEASDLLHQRITADLAAYARTIQEVDDLESLELACRYRKKLPLLSLKFQLMVFLAETLPENKRHFINDRSSASSALFHLSISFFRTLYKMCKGSYLLGRIDHE